MDEVIIKGWLAREQDGRLFFFTGKKPIKGEYSWVSLDCCSPKKIENIPFPSIHWDDPKPTKATITIKTEKQ